MEGIYLFSIDHDTLTSLIREAVRDAVKEATAPRIRLTKAEACRQLGVCFKTYQKMLVLTNRYFIYDNEIESFKQEYEKVKK